MNIELVAPVSSGKTAEKQASETVQMEEDKPEPYLTAEVTYWSDEIGAIDFESLPVYV